MELSHDDVKKILEIIDAAEHLDEIEVVYGGFHLHIQRGSATATSARAKPPLPGMATSALSPNPTARPACEFLTAPCREPRTLASPQSMT